MRNEGPPSSPFKKRSNKDKIVAVRVIGSKGQEKLQALTLKGRTRKLAWEVDLSDKTRDDVRAEVQAKELARTTVAEP